MGDDFAKETLGEGGGRAAVSKSEVEDEVVDVTGDASAKPSSGTSRGINATRVFWMVSSSFHFGTCL
jgi:hypothetical protein